MEYKTDVLIIGSGIAGLFAALSRVPVDAAGERGVRHARPADPHPHRAGGAAAQAPLALRGGVPRADRTCRRQAEGRRGFGTAEHA